MMATLTLGLVCLPLCLFGQEASQDALPEPDAAITVRELKHHLGFLASDELRGRAAGTPDAVRAARYLARALAQAGTQPAGDDGGYLQAMVLLQDEHKRAPLIEAKGEDGAPTSYVHGIDFDVRIQGAPRSSGLLQVLHVESMDELPSEPDPKIALFLDAGARERRQWLSASGNPNASGWGLLLSPGRLSNGASESLPRARLRVELDAGGDAPEGCDSVSANGDFLDGLRDWSILSIRISYDAERTETLDYNVVGRIQGVGTKQHPELAGECIVFSAHYDHIGVVGADAEHAAHGDQGDEGKDLIFNGADDDASGTAAVLELAQAFAAGPAPARTLVFLLAAGEEVGLLGTRFYLEHPAVPLAQTVANLNYEMIGRPDELAGGFGKLWLTGFERSTLGKAYQDLGLSVVPDPRLSQQYFQRSDNYAFAVRGIVAQTLSSYNSHSDYHQVTDELETIDFEHMAAALADGFRAAQLLADGSLRPEWLPGGKP